MLLVALFLAALAALPAAEPSARVMAATGPPELVAEYGGQLHALATDDEQLYVSLHSRLVVFDARSLHDAQPLAVSAPTGQALRLLAAKDGIVAGIGAELILWDTAAPGALRERSRLTLRQDVVGMTWVGRELWLRQDDHGIQRIDLSSPERPKSLGVWRPPQFPDTRPPIITALVSRGDMAGVLVEHRDGPGQQNTYELVLLQPGADGAVQHLGSTLSSEAGTGLAFDDDRVLIPTRAGRLLRVALDADLRPSRPEDIGRAPMTLSDGEIDLVFDGTRLWALQPNGRLAVGQPEGATWRWVEHPTRASAIAAAPRTAGPTAAAALLTVTAPAFVTADGALVTAAALPVESWGRVIPGRRGTWLVGYRSWAYADFGQPAWRAVPGSEGIGTDRAPGRDDGAGTYYSIGDEHLHAWRLDEGSIELASSLDVGAAIGQRPSVVLSADEAHVLLATEALDPRPGRVENGLWLLERSPAGELTARASLPYEGELGLLALSSETVWMAQASLLRTFDLRPAAGPELVPESIDFSPAGISALAARHGVVAIATGTGVALLDGLRPERRRIEGLLDMPRPFVFELDVAAPYVWAVATDFTTPSHLSLVDGSLLAHPTEIGHRRVGARIQSLRARGRHAWLNDDGAIQVFRAPERPTPPTAATPTASISPAPAPLTPTPTARPSVTATDTPEAARIHRAWLPRAQNGAR